MRQLLGCCCCCLRFVGLGILTAEPLDASGGIDQPLLARKEWVASRANFHVNVALVGRPGLEVVPAGALNLHCGVIGMNLFLWHRFRDRPFLQTFSSIVGGFGRFSNWGAGGGQGNRIWNFAEPAVTLPA